MANIHPELATTSTRYLKQEGTFETKQPTQTLTLFSLHSGISNEEMAHILKTLTPLDAPATRFFGIYDETDYDRLAQGYRQGLKDGNSHIFLAYYGNDLTGMKEYRHGYNDEENISLTIFTATSPRYRGRNLVNQMEEATIPSLKKKFQGFKNIILVAAVDAQNTASIRRIGKNENYRQTGTDDGDIVFQRTIPL